MNGLPDEAPRPRLPSDFPSDGPNSLGGFWARALARIVDVLLVFVPFVFLMVPFTTLDSTGHAASLPRWTALAFIGLLGLYETALVAWLGQTVGKMLVGVRVATLVNGRRPDAGQAALRALVPLTMLTLPVLVPVWPFVYLTAVFHPLGRGLHDQAGGTVVVRSR